MEKKVRIITHFGFHRDFFGYSIVTCIRLMYICPHTHNQGSEEIKRLLQPFKDANPTAVGTDVDVGVAATLEVC